MNDDERSSHNANANATDSSDKPTKECILCKEMPANQRPSDMFHWFRDCPTIDKVKNSTLKASRSSTSSRGEKGATTSGRRSSAGDVSDSD